MRQPASEWWVRRVGQFAAQGEIGSGIVNDGERDNVAPSAAQAYESFLRRLNHARYTVRSEE